jgi:hypothetical protein
MRTIRTGAAIFVLAASTLAAQSAADWSAVKALAPDARIRVETPSRKVTGQIQSVSDDAIVLRSDAGGETVMRLQVIRIAAKKAGHRGRNVLIGLGVGGGVGLGVGLSARSCKGLGCLGSTAVEAGAPPIFALLGAIVGAVIPTGGWRDIYYAPVAGPPAGAKAPSSASRL